MRTIGDVQKAMSQKVLEACGASAEYGDNADLTHYRELLYALIPSLMRETDHLCEVVAEANSGPDLSWQNGRGFGLDAAQVLREAVIARWSLNEYSPKYPFRDQLPFPWETEKVWKLVQHQPWCCGPCTGVSHLFEEMRRVCAETYFEESPCS